MKGCEASTIKERLLRSDSFNFKHCYFFGDFVKVRIQNSNQNINKVQTIGILDTTRLHSKIRNVPLRLDSVKYLVAAERRYHRNCYTNLLCTNFKIPRTCY